MLDEFVVDGRYWLRLPAHSPSLADQTSPPGSFPPTSLPPSIRDAGAKIWRHGLVVDDEALIRRSVSATLSGLGLDVEPAADGAGALEAIAGAAAPFDPAS